MHLNSELLFRKYAMPFFKDNIKVLEIGPAGFPSAYQKVVANPSIQWHTIDFEDTTFIESAAHKLTYKLTSPYKFPVESDKYDVIISGQVIEHVEKIWVWMDELKRVVKNGGHIITINPVSWPYHEAPVDCWRIYPAGIKALADQLDLKVDLCLTESIELDNLIKIDSKIKTIPGQSYAYPSSRVNDTNKIIRWNKFIRKLPMLKQLFEVPVEVAYDTISVLKK